MIRLLAIAFLVLFAGRCRRSPCASPASPSAPAPPAPRSRAGCTSQPGQDHSPRSSWPTPAPALIRTPTSGASGWRAGATLCWRPNSFGPRGEKQVCTTRESSRPACASPTSPARSNISPRSPTCIAGHVGLIGHSHGGSTVIRSVQKVFGLAPLGLRGRRRLLSVLRSGIRPRHRRAAPDPDRRQGRLDARRALPAARQRASRSPSWSRPSTIPTPIIASTRGSPDRTVPGAGQDAHLAYDPAAAPDAEARTKAFFDEVSQSTVIFVVLASSRHCAISRAIRRLELGRAVADRLDGVLVEARLHLGPVDRALGGGGELVDHRFGCPGRRDDAHPEIALEARHAFRHGRHVGNLLQAPGAGDGERVQLRSAMNCAEVV